MPPDRWFCPWCTRYLGAEEEPLYLAGLFRRAVANVADMLLLTLALSIPGVVFTVLAQNRSTAGLGALLSLGMWVAVVVVYCWLFAHGTTFGKLVLRVQVVRVNGEPPGFWTMLLREVIGKLLSGLLLYLGFLWAIWDQNRQAWHDKIAGTVVVHRKANVP